MLQRCGVFHLSAKHKKTHHFQPPLPPRPCQRSHFLLETIFPSSFSIVFVVLANNYFQLAGGAGQVIASVVSYGVVAFVQLEAVLIISSQMF